MNLLRLLLTCFTLSLKWSALLDCLSFRETRPWSRSFSVNLSSQRKARSLLKKRSVTLRSTSAAEHLERVSYRLAGLQLEDTLDPSQAIPCYQTGPLLSAELCHFLPNSWHRRSFSFSCFSHCLDRRRSHFPLQARLSSQSSALLLSSSSFAF